MVTPLLIAAVLVGPAIAVLTALFLLGSVVSVLADGVPGGLVRPNPG